MFQPLEQRVLMAVTASLANNGTLTVNGTELADNIYINASPGEQITVYVSNVALESFDKIDVERFVINGREGNDLLTVAALGLTARIDGGEGNDNISSGDGNDTLSGGDGLDTVNGGAGNDSVAGNADLDRVGGGIGNDTLLGGDGNDFLNGGTEDDLLDGGEGADVLEGSSGRDTVTYADRSAKVTVNISDVVNERNNDGEEGENDWVNVDIEIVIGGSGNDRIEGTTTAIPNSSVVDYDNELIGNGGNDTLIGLDGNDTLNGGAGTDDFQGGAGKDVADYSDRKQNLTLNLDGDANDGARGESDQIFADIEILWGGSGNDKLTGDARKNTLKGNGGNDRLDGGLGGDIFLGNAGADTVTYAKRSADLLIDIDGQNDDGEEGENDNVKRDVEKVIGGAGNDEMLGSKGANTLDGRAGNDVLIGLAGNDTLKGGKGNDELRGNAGVDRFLGGAGSDSLFARGDKKIDFLNGGKGNDEADADNNDELTSIEST